MAELAVVVPPAGPPRLSHDELAAAQKETLSAPRRSYSIAARALFATLDLVYGKPRTMPKFKVLEIVARAPYQTWEHVAYIAVTHVHQSTGLSKRIQDRIVEARSQQDNELWHLLILRRTFGLRSLPRRPQALDAAGLPTGA